VNELIRTLVRQAEEYAEVRYDRFRETPVFNECRDTKFAELIVQECIDTIVQDTANYPGEGMMAYYQGVQDAGKSIKQHFGVE